MRAPLVLAAAIVFSIIGSTRVAQFRYPDGLTAALVPCAPATIESRSRASPLIPSHELVESAGRPFRASARIFHPWRLSARAVSLPMPPVAPNTRAVLVVLVIISSSLRKFFIYNF